MTVATRDCAVIDLVLEFEAKSAAVSGKARFEYLAVGDGLNGGACGRSKVLRVVELLNWSGPLTQWIGEEHRSSEGVVHQCLCAEHKRRGE